MFKMNITVFFKLLNIYLFLVKSILCQIYCWVFYIYLLHWIHLEKIPQTVNFLKALGLGLISITSMIELKKIFELIFFPNKTLMLKLHKVQPIRCLQTTKFWKPFIDWSCFSVTFSVINSLEKFLTSRYINVEFFLKIYR